MMAEVAGIKPMQGEFKRAVPAGAPGRFEMVPVGALVVDREYQRDISAASTRVIRRIVAEFDWRKFLPVICVAREKYHHVIDGQHRATAAATLGIDRVPAYVLDCTPAEAAGAFAAINGTVTPVAPVDLWFSMLAAGDPEAVALQDVFEAAEVVVTRRKAAHGVGETRSINVLRRAYRFYGAALLTTILQCIVQTGSGNPGMLKGAVVNGIGYAIRSKPELLSQPSRLFDVFDGLDLGEMEERARVEAAQTGNGVQFILTREINAALRAAGVA